MYTLHASAPFKSMLAYCSLEQGPLRTDVDIGPLQKLDDMSLGFAHDLVYVQGQELPHLEGHAV